MSTITVTDIPLAADSPAARLRRMAAAVRIHFTWWGVHRTLSVQQREEMGDTYAADGRFLTAGKKIIDVKHEAYRRLTSIRSQVAAYWRGLTLPYVESAVRLIRQSDIETFVRSAEDFRSQLVQAEADLDRVYDQVKADARRRLGKLYEPADYPPQIRGLFHFEWDFPAIEPPFYLMQLNPDLYRQEQERVTARFEEAVRLAEQAFMGEFSRLVTHLTERLAADGTGEPKVFRDSVITNLVEFFGRFRQLNVGGSPQLDELVNQAQRIVRGLKPQDLRDSNSLREQVSVQFAQVQSTLDGLMVDRPRRRIIRPTTLSQGSSHANGD